jgi:N-carbamoylputrescine amidase
MTEVTIAATQMSCSDNITENVDKAETFIRQAADKGAQIILLQELFMSPYFCKDINHEYFEYAKEADNHPELKKMAALAKELSVVLPVSFFEKANQAYFNSVMVIDANGLFLGKYRKTHIPDAPGYYEKYYFNPGDTGARVWQTRYGNIGVGICWDQWFPELARIMVLKGADVIFYPTAIADRDIVVEKAIDKNQWQRVMQGHAVANATPICASNRVGVEQGKSIKMTFFGSSFITDEIGAIVTEADSTEETVLTATFDFEKINTSRTLFNFFRDRRPEHYKPILALDGS